MDFHKNKNSSKCIGRNSLESAETDTDIKADSSSGLNYIIHIDHPYQQKCIIKGSNIFKTIEFYKKVKKLIDYF
jgi:hypothetical protein